MIASNLAEQIAGTWTFIMAIVIIVCWVGLAQRWLQRIGRTLGLAAGRAQNTADIEALKMRAKGKEPYIGN